MIPIIIPTLDKKAGMKAAHAASEFAGVRCMPIIVLDESRSGFTRTVNRGIRSVLTAPVVPNYICLLNDDARPVTEDWLAELIKSFSGDQRVSFAGPSGPCRTAPQNGPPGPLKDGYKTKPIIVGHLSFFCVVIKTSVFKSFDGLLDTRYIHYGSDVDLQFKAKRLGHLSQWVPHVYVDHEVKDFINRWHKTDAALFHAAWGVS